MHSKGGIAATAGGNAARPGGNAASTGGNAAKRMAALPSTAERYYRQVQRITVAKLNVAKLPTT